MLAVPAESTLWDRPGLNLSDLSRKPFVMYSPDEAQSFFDLLNGLFQRSGSVPDVVQHAGTPYSILALVGIGLGAALVPVSARLFPARNVRFLPISLPTHARIDFLATWRSLNDNPALPHFVATIERMIKADQLHGQ